MYERFADSTRKAMQLANQEAQRLHHEYIGTEHVLLALTKLGDPTVDNSIAIGVPGKVVTLEQIRQQVERFIQTGPDLITMGKLPQTPRAKKVVEHAIEQSAGGEILPIHLLMGCLLENEGVAAHVLKHFGYTISGLQLFRVMAAANSQSTPTEEKPAAESCKTCRFYYEYATRSPGVAGFCRRRAPVRLEHTTDHPAVRRTYWCGEYEKQTN